MVVFDHPMRGRLHGAWCSYGTTSQPRFYGTKFEGPYTDQSLSTSERKGEDWKERGANGGTFYAIGGQIQSPRLDEIQNRRPWWSCWSCWPPLERLPRNSIELQRQSRGRFIMDCNPQPRCFEEHPVENDDVRQRLDPPKDKKRKNILRKYSRCPAN